MPTEKTLRAPDGRERVLTIPDGATPEQIGAAVERAKKLMLSEAPQGSVSPAPGTGDTQADPTETTRNPGFFQAVGDTLKGRVKEVAEPMGRIIRGGGATPATMGDLANVGLNAASWATQPALMGTGVAAEVGGRMLGGERGGQVGRSGVELGGATLGAGKLLYQGTKSGLKKAGELAARSLGTTEAEEAGTALRGRLSTVAASARARVKPMFQQPISTAIQNKVTVMPGSPEFDQAVGVAQQVNDLLPNLTGPGKKVVTRILKAAQGSDVPSGSSIGGVAITKASGPQGIPFKDLEMMHKMIATAQQSPGLAATAPMATPRVLGGLRKMIRDVQEASLSGFPDEQKMFSEARNLWKTEVAPLNQMGRVASRGSVASPLQSPTGREVMSKFKAFGQDPERIRAAINAVGPNSPEAALVRSSMWNEFTRGKNPQQISNAWDALDPGMKDILRHTGGSSVDKTMKMLGKIGSVTEGQKNIVHRNLGALLTAGTTGAVFQLGRSSFDAGMLQVPLGALLGLGGAKAAALVRRALITPQGTEEAARVGALLGHEINRAVDYLGAGAEEHGQ